MMTFLAPYFAIVVGGLLLAHIVLTRRHTRKPLPPGPRADPIIGHLRKIPSAHQPEVFHEWAKKYGDVLYLEVLGRKMVILDSLEAANDLLEKRSSIYSCRPKLVIFNMMGWDRNLVLLQYGKRFLLHRKLLQNYFGRQESMAFNPISYEESIVLVKRLMDNPTDYDKIIERYMTCIFAKIAYGYTISDDNDPFSVLAYKVGKMLHNSGPPASTPVDLFPWLANFPSWFPGTYYAEYARKWRGLTSDFINYPFDFTTKQLSEGKAQPSFLSKYLSDLESQDIEDSDQEDYMEDIKNAASQIYGAGAETSWGTLVVFLIAMVLYPEYQAKAQAEIDAVCGHDRLPTFEDYESLPYIEYIMREVMRWHPAVPMGVPHRSLEDDVYKGMFIPAGSISQGGREEPYLSPFGFGRRNPNRICPGRFFAESTIWITIAMILATCKIGKAKNASGMDITPEVEFDNGFCGPLEAV
ncbi:cytochrome P450 [Gymnopus androsaceus JB14]|uniref:Cytochrome P450 n=1 Tax=Gymnopus androsaceus JB14 TaxID=1447944 RepID=A0A6A4GT61_9AGAR|nr:cytochrome P450 [Gymnopus androsaceus JB14]